MTVAHSPEPAKPLPVRIVASLLCAYHGGWGGWYCWQFWLATRSPSFDPASIPLQVARALIPFALAWLYAIGLRLLGVLTWSLLGVLSFLTCLASLCFWRGSEDFILALLLQAIPFLATLYGLSEALRWNRRHPAPESASGLLLPARRLLMANLGCGASVLGALGLVSILALRGPAAPAPPAANEAPVQLYFETSRVRVVLGGRCRLPVKLGPGLSQGDLAYTVEEGAAGGTVDAQGGYQAPPQPGIFHVSVQSRSRSNLKDRCTVEVKRLLWELSPVQNLFTPPWSGLPVPLDDNHALFLPTAESPNLQGRPWILDLTWGSETTLDLPVGLLPGGQAIPLGQGRVLATRAWGQGLGPNGGPCLIDTRRVRSTSFPALAFRGGGTVTLLADGRVLLAGGCSETRAVDTVDILDPDRGGVIRTTHLFRPRQQHTATRLDSGALLIAGGRGAGGAALRICEVLAGTPLSASETCALAEPRSAHTATLLGDGRVLLCGGVDGSGQVTGSVEVYDPAGGRSIWVGSLMIPRFGHKTLLLRDGSVLVTGGRDRFGLPVTTMECLDTASWKSQLLPFPGSGDEQVSAVRLPTGEVYVLCRTGRRPVYGLR